MTSWFAMALDEIRTGRIFREKADCKQSNVSLTQSEKYACRPKIQGSYHVIKPLALNINLKQTGKILVLRTPSIIKCEIVNVCNRQCNEQSSLPGRQCNHNGSNIALGLSEDKLPEKPFPVGHFLIWPIRVCPAEQGMFWDQFRFPGNCPPTPPLSQHYHLLLTQGKILA